MRACHSSSLTRERSGFTRASWSGAVLVVIGNAPRPGGSGPDISTRTECGCRQARARPKIIAGGPPCADAISASAWPGLPPCPGLAGPIRAAAAEAAEVRIARQYGLPYLSMMVMERQALIEKHATQQGLPGLRAQWTTLGGTSALTDGLLSGRLDFIVPGVPALVTLWDKTVGTAQEVRALSAVQSTPFVLVTRNPAVRSIADFGAGDRIALPAVKLSAQAVALEMAAAKLWGFAAYDRLDALTVTLPHPDAVTALLAGNSPITSHYTVSPFHYYELANRRCTPCSNPTTRSAANTPTACWSAPRSSATPTRSSAPRFSPRKRKRTVSSPPTRARPRRSTSP